MRLVYQRKGGLTIRAPASGKVYRFKQKNPCIDVAEARDAAYILAVHGASIETDPPLASGWAVYNGEERSQHIKLLTGDIELYRDEVLRVRLCQQLELEERHHWPKVTPVQTYRIGMRRLLITRDAGMGDLLMLASAFRGLKAVCPELSITLATEPAWLNLLRDQPGIEGLVLMGEETAAAPFDQYINLVQWVERAESGRSKHRVDVFGEALGIDLVDDKSVMVPLDKAERDAAKAEFASEPGPLIGVVYRGSTNARSYPKDMIPALCAALDACSMGVALIDHGPQPDVPLPAGAFRVCKEPRDLAAAISAMDAIVSPDTGPVHLAAAVGTPVVALASTVPPEMRWSGYDNVTVMDGCQRIGCNYCHDGPSCRPAGIGSESLTDWAPPCLRALGPDEIADKVLEVVG